MSLWIVIPVRPFDEGKTRLSPVLSPDRRVSVCRLLFQRTLIAALAAAGDAPVLVVSSSDEALAFAQTQGAQTFRETQPRGHNAAASTGQAYAMSCDAQHILSLSTDLPLLSAEDVHALIEAVGDVVAAPDIDGKGTNALRLTPPACIPYSYGPGSLGKYAAAAALSELTFTQIQRPGLALDLDTPEDLKCAESHGFQPP